MKIYDISQEVFGCRVYAGDPMPEKKLLCSMEEGSLYNLTAFSMCAHNGTHIDAPFHFIKGGKTVDSIGLDTFIGMAYVAECHGIVSGTAAAEIIEKAKKQNPEAAKRILLRGDAEVSSEAAEVFAGSEILLLGNESQTVGPETAPMEVHLILLGAGIVLLEGIRLAEVSEGIYFLNAAPLNLSGADGSPCRAVLIAAERYESFHTDKFNFAEATMKNANRLIGCCGLDCEKCDARIATLTNDNALREKTAALWTKLNGVPITPERINCTGCRIDGAKTPFCDKLCPVHNCVREKGLDTCADCGQMDGCPTLGRISVNSTFVLENLNRLREANQN